MSYEIVLQVPKVIATNPVAKAIERARLKAWLSNVEKLIQSFVDGQRCDDLLLGVTEVLGIAMRATEDCDDPADIRGTMNEALRRLEGMAIAGSWQADAAPLIAEAVDYAAQIVQASTAQERMAAWGHVLAIKAAAQGVSA